MAKSRRKTAKKPPAAPPVRASSESRADSFVNALAGFGVSGLDKTLNTAFELDAIAYEDVRNLWRGNYIAKRIIERPVKDSFRRGLSVPVGDDEEASRQIMTRLSDLKAIQRFIRVAMFSRAYGGGALMPVIEDGLPLTEPLDTNRILRCHAIHAIEPRRLQPQLYNDDIDSAEYDEPLLWRVTPSARPGFSGRTEIVHATRLILMPGVRVSDEQVSELPGHGDSVLMPVQRVLNDYGITWTAAASLMYEFAQGVLKLKNLADLVAQDNGEIFKRRLIAMNVGKSVLKAMAIDSEDDFRREQTPISGMSDMLEQFRYEMAGAANQPVALLFGKSASGMNATGDFDIRSYYDDTDSMRSTEYAPLLEQLIRIAVIAPRDGYFGGVEPEEYSVKFKPMWQPTEKEQADTEKVITDTDVARIDAQIMTPDEARGRMRGDTFQHQIVLEGEIEPPKPSPEQVALLKAQNAKVDPTAAMDPAMMDPAAKKRRAAIEAILAAPDNPGDQNAA